MGAEEENVAKNGAAAEPKDSKETMDEKTDPDKSDIPDVATKPGSKDSDESANKEQFKPSPYLTANCFSKLTIW